MKKTINTTGGCGQIGSHIAELSLKRGDQILVTDNFATKRREHLPETIRTLNMWRGPMLQAMKGESITASLIHFPFSIPPYINQEIAGRSFSERKKERVFYVQNQVLLK